MLFAGRLADLFPAQWLFEGGLFLLGVLMLVLSFSACSPWRRRVVMAGVDVDSLSPG
jgi:hypothetical protein